MIVSRRRRCTHTFTSSPSSSKLVHHRGKVGSLRRNVRRMMRVWRCSLLGGTFFYSKNPDSFMQSPYALCDLLMPLGVILGVERSPTALRAPRPTCGNHAALSTALQTLFRPCKTLMYFVAVAAHMCALGRYSRLSRRHWCAIVARLAVGEIVIRPCCELLQGSITC